MNRYRYRSVTRWVSGLALKALALVVGLVLFLAIIQPLLVTIAGVAISVMVGTVWVRWRLFRHRGW
jgi:uncharacterized membrane protein